VTETARVPVPAEIPATPPTLVSVSNLYVCRLEELHYVFTHFVF